VGGNAIGLPLQSKVSIPVVASDVQVPEASHLHGA
jgi:hypothetical protein